MRKRMDSRTGAKKRAKAERRAKRTAKRAKKTAKHNSPPPLNGETLRDAMAWVLNEKIFAHLKLHGNTSWQALDLIVLAVVWVWSGDSTVTGALTQANHWSLRGRGRAAVNTSQAV